MRSGTNRGAFCTTEATMPAIMNGHLEEPPLFGPAVIES
jgi:hypothetical protein